MMDYMYKGEVSVPQDQLGYFLNAAGSLQIKGLTYVRGGQDNVTYMSQRRQAPTSTPNNQSQSRF